MATRCGTPVGPMVAMVPVRLCSSIACTSASLITICARWFAMGRTLRDQRSTGAGQHLLGERLEPLDGRARAATA